MSTPVARLVLPLVVILLYANPSIAQTCGVSHKDFRSLQAAPHTLPAALQTETIATETRYLAERSITLDWPNASHALTADHKAETFIIPLRSSAKRLIDPIPIRGDSHISEISRSATINLAFTEPGDRVDLNAYNAKYRSENLSTAQQWMIYVYHPEKPVAFYLEAVSFLDDPTSVTVFTRPDGVKMVTNYGDNLLYYVPSAKISPHDISISSELSTFLSCLDQATGTPDFSSLAAYFNSMCTFVQQVQTMIALAAVCAPCTELVGCPVCIAAWAGYLTCTSAGIVNCYNTSVGTGGGTPGFSLSASPPSLIISAGQTATYTITASFTGGGFTSVSGFFVQNLFDGAAVSFNPPSVSPSQPTTTMTIATTSTTQEGDRILTIGATANVGSGTGPTSTTTLELNINGSSTGGPTVTWTTPPPQTFQIGQQLPLAWQASGGTNGVYSHVHVGTDPDPADYPGYKTDPKTGGDGSYSDTTTPSNQLSGLNPGTIVYLVVHVATDPSYNGAPPNYYSMVAQSTVSSGSSGGAPIISGVNPQTAPVGVETPFYLTGTGFMQGLTGTLWVNSQSFPVAQSKTTVVDSSHVTLAVRVGAVGDPTTPFGLQVTNPGGQASAIFNGLTALGGGSGGQTAGVQVSFIPNPVSQSQVSTCNGNGYAFTFQITETQGVGITPTGMTYDQTPWTPQGFSQHIPPFGTSAFSITWCRGLGSSVWVVTAQDDNGHTVTGSGTVTFQ